jgi:NADH:ubiquinone oxidoreductase subunit F (NADH-binding)
MNRALIESDPHAVLEGILIGGYAIGASQGIIYVRAEYPLAVTRLKKALEQMREYHLIGENILDSGFDFEITIREGAGRFCMWRRNGIDRFPGRPARHAKTAPALSRHSRAARLPHPHQ